MNGYDYWEINSDDGIDSYEYSDTNNYWESKRQERIRKEKRKKQTTILIIVFILSAMVLGLFLFLHSNRKQQVNASQYSHDGTYRYFHSTLYGKELELYDTLLIGLLNHEEEISLDETDDILLEKTVIKICADNPDCFWFEGSYGIMTYTLGNYSNMSFRPEYTMDISSSEYCRRLIDNYVSNIEENTSGMSDYQKVKYAYEYLIENTKYDISNTDQTCVSVITKGVGTCAGYSAAFSLILNRLGIPSVICMGSSEGDPHAWNLVKINNNWYHVDTTFGDPVTSDGSNWITYDYFLITDREIFADHEYDEGLNYPKTGPELDEKIRDSTLIKRQTA